jgi:hypothetical protein
LPQVQAAGFRVEAVVNRVHVQQRRQGVVEPGDLGKDACA